MIKDIIKNKKILLSLLTISAIAGMGAYGTVSYYSETENSAGNTFEAGDFDLLIDNTCHYNGKECKYYDSNNGFQPGYYWNGDPAQESCSCTWLEKDLAGDLFFNFNDVKPGDSGEDTISLHIIENPAWVCAQIENLVNQDNSCRKPEQDAGDITCDTPGIDQGELQNHLFFTVWKDNGADSHACNNILDADENAIITNQSAQTGIWPIADSTTGQPIDAGATVCYGIKWNIPLETSSIIQSDSLVGDIKIMAVQSFNMESFKCSDLNLSASVCGNGAIESGETCDDGNIVSEDGCSATCQTENTDCVPTTEVCDGQDNDCDGVTDEDNVCGPAEVSCTDGLDNDADGKIDCQDPGCFYNSLDCIAPVCGDQTCRSPLETYQNCPADCPAPAPQCTVDGDCPSPNNCTTGACVSGQCVFTPHDAICNDINSCTSEICSIQSGCIISATTGVGSSCSNLICMLNGSNCLGYTCNASGACVAPAVPPGGCTADGQCNDNNACTADYCSNGVCQHTNIVLSQCIFGGSCIGGAVTCNSNPNCPNNCDDSNACTTDICSISGCTNVSTPNTLDCGSNAFETCSSANGQHYCQCYLAPLTYPNCSISLPSWPF